MQDGWQNFLITLAVLPVALLCSAGGQVAAEERSVPCLENYTGEIVYAAKAAGVECMLGDPTCLKYKVTCIACPLCTSPLHLCRLR